jgi:hypothetical protein
MHNLNGIQKWIDLECGFKPHLSASNINTFKDNLSMWILRYGFGMDQGGSPAMDRGTVIEQGLVTVLTENLTLAQATQRALDLYDEYKHWDVDEHNKQKEVIAPILKNAYEALVDYGIPDVLPDGKQHMIEFDLVDTDNNWSADIIGYLDLVYPDQGLIVDLKTTLRMPPEMSWSHKLQRAIYQAGKDNYTVKFLYVTKNKAEFKEDGDKSILEEAKVLVNKMNNFCFSFTPNQARLCIPLVDDYRFKGQQHLREFYNAS